MCTIGKLSSFVNGVKAGKGETVKAEQSQSGPSVIPSIGKGVGLK